MKKLKVLAGLSFSFAIILAGMWFFFMLLPLLRIDLIAWFLTFLDVSENSFYSAYHSSTTFFYFVFTLLISLGLVIVGRTMKKPFLGRTSYLISLVGICQLILFFLHFLPYKESSVAAIVMSHSFVNALVVHGSALVFILLGVGIITLQKELGKKPLYLGVSLIVLAIIGSVMSLASSGVIHLAGKVQQIFSFIVLLGHYLVYPLLSSALLFKAVENFRHLEKK